MTDRVTELHQLDRCDHDLPLLFTCPGCHPDALYARTSDRGRAALRAAAAFGGARVVAGTPEHTFAELRSASYITDDGVLTLAGQAAVTALTDILRGDIPEPEHRLGPLPVWAVKGERVDEPGALAGFYVVRAPDVDTACRYALTHTRSPLTRAWYAEPATERLDAFRNLVARVPSSEGPRYVAEQLTAFADSVNDRLLVQALVVHVEAHG